MIIINFFYSLIFILIFLLILLELIQQTFSILLITPYLINLLTFHIFCITFKIILFFSKISFKNYHKHKSHYSI
jgi:hypothetical protein